MMLDSFELWKEKFQFLKCLICNRKRTECSPIRSVIVHSTHYLISDWPKAYSEFQNQRLGRHLAADYTIIKSRTLNVTGNHVMYNRGA